MAAARRTNSQTEIEQLQGVFGSINAEDCQILLEEFGGGDVTEVATNVYEALTRSGLDSVAELVWHIKQNPLCDIGSRSRSLETECPKRGGDSWMLAKSKSGGSINKNAASSAISQGSGSSGDTRGPDLSISMPYSGTRNPIQFRRNNKSMDNTALRPYLTKYLQDTEVRNLLFDIYENQEKKLLILMRGASGSGKSTLAQIIWAITDAGEICSADNYFVSRSGIYKFSRPSLPQAHGTCKNHCKTALARGDTPIIIDNTNMKVDEMIPYVKMAVDYNYDIKILEPKTEWKTKPGILAQKNVHGVPKKTIEDQLERYEKTTVKAMVDSVLKRQGVKGAYYRPNADLEWGGRTLDPHTEAWLGYGASAQSDAAQLTPLFTSMSLSPAKGNPKTTGTSPLPWTEPPSNTPPSPLLLSDLLPDLSRVSNGTTPKPKRASRRSGNANNAAASRTVPGSAQRVKPQFDDPAHLAFAKLCKLFPTVAVEELEPLFYTYECDVDVCASALLEQGKEMTGSLEANEPASNEDSQSLASNATTEGGASGAILASNATTEEGGASGAMGYDFSQWNIPTNPIEPYSTNMAHNEVLPNSVYENAELASFAGVEGFGEGASGDEESDALEMILPVEFARLLLSVYGHPDDERRSLTLDELTVKIPADAAFEIYKSLYLNMHKTENGVPGLNSNNEGSTRSNSPTSSSIDNDDDEFNAMAISLSLMELEINSDNPQLANIMDIESQISQHTQDALQCYSAKNRTMAQNINFSMLKQDYPFLDSSVLDEIYTQSCLDVDKTKAWLNEMYPNSLAQIQAAKSAPANTTTSQFKYNPKDVRLYSTEDIKSVQRQHSELEQEWKRKMTKMREYYEKVTSVSNPQIKAHYITESKKISEEMKDLADELQYYKCLSMNAKHKNDQVLDLHGLKINGAMRVLKEFLQYKEDEFKNSGIPKMILLIITGKGKHSRNGCPVLQPAVKNFLTQRQYRFTSGTGNPGTFSVYLTRGVLSRLK